MNCKETLLVDKWECSMRSALLRKLNKENWAARRTGAIPGTPTPVPRIGNLQQLKESNVEEDTYFTNFYYVENK
ncbi:hypothetical protein FRC12_022754 [Ceratobasidium sp. 428]|nr:hypothetical protein FRC12_022754 [Ceratobasidium sp. 428]